jgi:hypothetical protein
MNDPHIEALHYSIRHRKEVDYDKAEPLRHETAGFTVRVENGCADVAMKSHHATVKTACDEVAPFLRAWELTAEFAAVQMIDVHLPTTEAAS